MGKKVLLLCIITFIACMGCNKSEKYADVRAYISDMEAYLNQYADTMARAENAGDVARAIDQYIVKMTEFAERSSSLAKKYPELARDEIPGELKADFERLNETANALPDKISEPLEKYMSDPLVLNAILNRANKQEEIIGMGMGKE
ncbi:MAG: hypothetical protein CVV44_12395 [Spirochaetae bacterium HGW-Spirochaetae-1]|jgi:Tfp pilus assembly protein PilP|nr:MAG: hypothetical protein CVV44_12395 [Spirochaetae bacterium HGW-Spirochaetae-1]